MSEVDGSSGGRRMAARWNLISVFAACVGMFATYVVFGVATSRHPGSWFGGVDPAMNTLLGFSALGILAAVIAAIRAERLWALTAVGFLLNGTPLAFYAWDAIQHG